MNSRPKDPKTARNKNVLVVGGSGSGKTRFFIKPNLMQLHSSYVVTDPKGSIVVECGKLLQRNQYKIKILNTINFKKSHHYNPFAYLHSEKDILKLVTTLIANTQGDGKSGDDFWRKAETLLYTALIGYIYYEAPVEEQNFATLIEMINTMEVREDDEDFKNPVDLMFEELAKREPHHFAVRQYAKYRLGVHCPSIGKGDIAHCFVRQSIVHRAGDAHCREVKVIGAAGGEGELLWEIKLCRELGDVRRNIIARCVELAVVVTPHKVIPCISVGAGQAVGGRCGKYAAGFHDNLDAALIAQFAAAKVQGNGFQPVRAQ